MSASSFFLTIYFDVEILNMEDYNVKIKGLTGITLMGVIARPTWRCDEP